MKVKCPKCGSINFREAQVVEEWQEIVWNEKDQTYEYGRTEFCSIQNSDGIQCAQCHWSATRKVVRDLMAELEGKR
jgi:DNA-directed RNA polymerase subunit RPC12/RpoP